MQGFNYYGISFVDKVSVESFVNIIANWRNLFSQAPEEINLTGPFTWKEGEAINSGKYEKLIFKKQEVLDVFYRLEILGTKVMSEESTIVYFGI